METHNLVYLKLDFMKTGSGIVTKITLTEGNVFMMAAMKLQLPFPGEMSSYCFYTECSSYNLSLN
jgi:hypothetical protein